MFLILSRCRRCRPCCISRIKCSRDLPCQTCVRRGRPDLCVYEELSRQQSRRQRKRRRLAPNDPPTQSEEPSNRETETQQDGSGAIQPAIQCTDTGDPDVDTTSSTQEPAEGKAISKNSCDLKSTRDEVENGHLPILANATLPDAEWTRPYFQMCLPVKMSGSTTFEALFADDCADWPPIARHASTPSL